MHEALPPEPVPEPIQAGRYACLEALLLWMQLLSAGPLLVGSTLALLRLARPTALFARVAPSLSLAFAGTAVLLWIAREAPKRPRRQYTELWIIAAFTIDAFLWLLWVIVRPGQLRTDLVWSGLAVAMVLAGYPTLRRRSARLWRPLLAFPHLVAQAFIAGSAFLVLALAYFGGSRANANVLLRCLLGGLCAHGAFLLIGIALSGRRRGKPALRGMLSGPMAARFWVLAVLMGTALPVYMLTFHFARPQASGMWGAIAAALVLPGLLAYANCCAVVLSLEPSVGECNLPSSA